MDGDDRPVVLLDLLFPEGESGDEGNVECLLNRHLDALSPSEERRIRDKSRIGVVWPDSRSFRRPLSIGNFHPGLRDDGGTGGEAPPPRMGDLAERAPLRAGPRGEAHRGEAGVAGRPRGTDRPRDSGRLRDCCNVAPPAGDRRGTLARLPVRTRRQAAPALESLV